MREESLFAFKADSVWLHQLHHSCESHLQSHCALLRSNYNIHTHLSKIMLIKWHVLVLLRLSSLHADGPNVFIFVRF